MIQIIISTCQTRLLTQRMRWEPGAASGSVRMREASQRSPRWFIKHAGSHLRRSRRRQRESAVAGSLGFRSSAGCVKSAQKTRWRLITRFQRGRGALKRAGPGGALAKRADRRNRQTAEMRAAALSVARPALGSSPGRSALAGKQRKAD